jgi:hypothetical protein
MFYIQNQNIKQKNQLNANNHKKLKSAEIIENDLEPNE